MITPTSGFRFCFSDLAGRVFMAGNFLRLVLDLIKENAGPSAGSLYSVTFYGVFQSIARVRQIPRPEGVENKKRFNYGQFCAA